MPGNDMIKRILVQDPVKRGIERDQVPLVNKPDKKSEAEFSTRQGPGHQDH